MSILDSLPRPTGLVCGYGERNAAASAGMLEAVTATGWRPDIVVGSSMGALTAAAAIVDMDRGGQLAATLWSQVSQNKLVDPGWTRIAAASRGSENGRVNKGWRELLRSIIGDATFADDSPHALVATNLTQSVPEVITSGSLIDAVIASAAFPVFTNPATIDGDTIVDGGFIAPLPVLQAETQGARSIVVLQTGRPLYNDQPSAPSRWYEVVLASVRSQLGATASHDIAAAATRVPIVVLETPRPAQLHWADVTERISTGARDAQEQLSALDDLFIDGVDQPGVYTAADEVLYDLRLKHVIRHFADGVLG